MTPGPSIYYECISCKKTIEITTINSGNTFSARYWTDGYMKANMLPDSPKHRKCPHCGKLFWIEELKKLGEEDDEGEIDKAWGKIKRALEFSISDYLTAIKNNLAKTEEENEYLRVHAWWAFNNGQRWPPRKRFIIFNRKPTPTVDANAFRDNLIVLQEILNADVQSERLLRAEIARELGQFEECMSLLDFEFDDSLLHKKKFILKCCKENSSIVQDMTDYLKEKEGQAKEKYTLQRNKYIEEGMNFVKTQALAKGIATENNFYSVIHNLTVKEFVALRGDYKDLHTIHFPKSLDG